jgi:hypothetical protein
MASKKSKDLPRWNSIDELVDYFNSHDMGDHFDHMPEVQIDVDIKSKKYLVAIEEELISKLADIAKKESISSEQLINSWLKERILETTH